MKIKLDENIPISLAYDLEKLGHDVSSVYHLGMQGTTDQIVWKKVQAEERFLITQDLDFSDVNQYSPGKHAGILLVRLRDPGRTRLRQQIQDLFASDVPAQSWNGAFVVLTDHKLRVKRPE